LLLSWGLNNNGSIGQGVFIFQVGDYIKGTMVGVQKRLTKRLYLIFLIILMLNLIFCF
jgi:hypothetical protein